MVLIKEMSVDKKHLELKYPIYTSTYLYETHINIYLFILARYTYFTKGIMYWFIKDV